MDDTRRLTYAELASARGVTVATARRMATRYKWAKSLGNDGLARVAVPEAALRAPTGANGASSIEDETPVHAPMAAVEAVVGALREELVRANERTDRANERAERAERVAGVLRAKLVTARYVGEVLGAEVADLRRRLDASDARLTAVLEAPRKRYWWPWGRKLVWAGVVWAVAGPALAAADFTGNALLELCLDVDGTETKLTYCLGYTRGVAESLDLRTGAGLCMPTGVTDERMRDVMIRYLVNNPLVRQDPAVELTRLALIEAFPCKR